MPLILFWCFFSVVVFITRILGSFQEGGGFTWFGVTNNKLDALSNVKSTVTENSKRTEINQKEIELLKLQIKEIQLKSGNPLSN